MAQFLHLTEARIRDFNRRKEAGETRPAAERDEGGSLESMLFDEVVELQRQLRRANDSRRAAELRQRIRSLETRILVSLESSERPLMARIMAERLRELSRGEG